MTISSSLSSNLRIVQRSGLGIIVVDEAVGTGNASNADFDLDFDNVISESYTLSAATSGSNTFTALTETTDYTLDKPSGRIKLTAAGITALSTKVLYASYTYLGSDLPITDAVITEYQSIATQRMREMTGRVWASTSLTEYKDGVAPDSYPRTDMPFSVMQPRYERSQITLDEGPIRSVTQVLFLDRNNVNFAGVYSYDGATYVDETEDALTGDTSFYPFSSVSTSGNALYIGMANKFLGLFTIHTVLGVDGGSLAVTWEYYNGSTWTAVSGLTAGTTGSNLFTADGKVTWTKPLNWAVTTVDSSDSLYFIRARISAGSFSTLPQLREVYPDPDGVISSEVSPRNVQCTPQGRLTFLADTIPSGVKNIRVDYVAGVSSTDKDYYLGGDLCTLYAALMCVVSATGGSYDNETRFELGTKAVTVGEVYVNVAEVVKQIQGEIRDLLRAVGYRAEMATE